MSADDDANETLMMGDEEKTVLLQGGGGADEPAAKGRAADARLVCLDDSALDPSQKGVEITLTDGEYTVGRGEDNDITILASSISRRHARLFVLNGRWGVEDLGSANGVWVNDVRKGQSALRHEDFIRFGEAPFRFLLKRPELEADSGPVEEAAEEDSSGDGEAETMFLDGATADRAARALEEAEEARREKQMRQAAQPRAPQSAPREAEHAPFHSGVGQGSKEGGKRGLFIGLMLLVLVGGAGAGWFFLGKDPQADLLHDVSQTMKDVSAEVGQAAGSGDYSGLAERLTRLEGLQGRLKAALAGAPDPDALIAAQVRVEMVAFESRLMGVLHGESDGRGGGGNNAARELVEKTARWVSQRGELAGEGAQEIITESSQMLELVGHMIAIDGFKARFPDPTGQSGSAPDAAELAQYREARSGFVALFTENRINLALSLRYPLLAKLAHRIKDRDLALLDRW